LAQKKSKDDEYINPDFLPHGIHPDPIHNHNILHIPAVANNDQIG